MCVYRECNMCCAFFSGDHCEICLDLLNSDSSVVGEKGLRGLRNASHIRKDKKQFYIGQRLHLSCRNDYVNSHCIARDRKRRHHQQTSPEKVSALRSKKARFSISENCLFCGQLADKKNKNVFPFTTLVTCETLLKCCDMRMDVWAEVVRSRLQSVHALPAADALYNAQCSINFRTPRLGIPKAFHPKDYNERYRPKQIASRRKTRNNAFEKIT